jgi:hypothetical protein
LDLGIDTFGFLDQFGFWCTPTPMLRYPRMLVRASAVWSHLPELFGFMGIHPQHLASFPQLRQRSSSFQQLSDDQQARMNGIYGELDCRMASSADLRILG